MVPAALTGGVGGGLDGPGLLQIAPPPNHGGQASPPHSNPPHTPQLPHPPTPASPHQQSPEYSGPHKPGTVPQVLSVLPVLSTTSVV